MPDAASPNSGPLLAIIANVQTPYRVHLHRRIVREIPGIRIASLYTHGQADQPWDTQRVEEINPVFFSRSQPVVQQTYLRWARVDWLKGGRIISWLKEHGVGAVILGGYSDAARIRIIRWCRRAGVPCFVLADSNIHGDTVGGIRRLFKNLVVRWVVRNSVGLMPCGTAGQKFFERYGATPDRCYFVPYEPDYDLIRSLPESDVAKARADLKLRADRKYMVVCSRLVAHKRVDLATDAFAAIASERPQWDLVVIGDGPQREALKAGVPAVLRDRIIWTGFLGDQSRISAVYRASHLLVCPSDVEPWGVVINEAAAGGLAIVASSVVGAAAELVRDGVNGRCFPVGDLGALTECLRDVTRPDKIEGLREGSVTVLALWQARGDPVKGVRRALDGVGFVPKAGPAKDGFHRATANAHP